MIKTTEDFVDPELTEMCRLADELGIEIIMDLPTSLIVSRGHFTQIVRIGDGGIVGAIKKACKLIRQQEKAILGESKL